MTEATDVQIMPDDDVVPHEGERCACLPRIKYVACGDLVPWRVVVHHRWDGRQ